MTLTKRSKKVSQLVFIAFLTLSFIGSAQYTDVINSNRPGASVSAYAVGSNVAQIEMGIVYEDLKHSILETESSIIGTDIALRYGLFFEQLEVYWEGTFIKEQLNYIDLDSAVNNTNFTRNRAGLKFLIYDPFKNPDYNKPNLYSWNANHKFQLRDLLPAVSVYGGVNFVFGDNPFYVGEPSLSYRAMIATQSRLTPRFVLVTNVAYDRITTDFPELSFVFSITRALQNPKWSVFIENQTIKSDRYADVLMRTGAAYLVHDLLQVDINFGGSFKNTPSRFFASIGASYRFDFHKDKLVPIQDQKSGENGSLIKKNSMKKKNGKMGPSKKEIKKRKKATKKKQKEAGEIEF